MVQILEKYTTDRDNLIQILNEVQENYGYIPKYSQISISEYLDIPLAEIYGVITFYARFTLKPKGKYNIAVCLGTACFVKGSEKVLDKAKEISPNLQSRDNKLRNIDSKQKQSEFGVNKPFSDCFVFLNCQR